MSLYMKILNEVRGMKMSVNQPESHDSVELAESAEPFMLLGLVVDIQESIPT